MKARRDIIKLQSDKIGMSVERMRESAGQEEKKRNSEIEEKKKSEKEEKKKKKGKAPKNDKKRKLSDSSISVVEFDKKTKMKLKVEV